MYDSLKTVWKDSSLMFLKMIDSSFMMVDISKAILWAKMWSRLPLILASNNSVLRASLAVAA